MSVLIFRFYLLKNQSSATIRVNVHGGRSKNHRVQHNIINAQRENAIPYLYNVTVMIDTIKRLASRFCFSLFQRKMVGKYIYSYSSLRTSLNTNVFNGYRVPGPCDSITYHFLNRIFWREFLKLSNRTNVGRNVHFERTPFRTLIWQSVMRRAGFKSKLEMTAIRRQPLLTFASWILSFFFLTANAVDKHDRGKKTEQLTAICTDIMYT